MALGLDLAGAEEDLDDFEFREEDWEGFEFREGFLEGLEGLEGFDITTKDCQQRSRYVMETDPD